MFTRCVNQASLNPSKCIKSAKLVRKRTQLLPLVKIDLFHISKQSTLILKNFIYSFIVRGTIKDAQLVNRNFSKAAITNTIKLNKVFPYIFPRS